MTSMTSSASPPLITTPSRYLKPAHMMTSATDDDCGCDDSWSTTELFRPLQTTTSTGSQSLKFDCSNCDTLDEWSPSSLFFKPLHKSSSADRSSTIDCSDCDTIDESQWSPSELFFKQPLCKRPISPVPPSLTESSCTTPTGQRYSPTSPVGDNVLRPLPRSARSSIQKPVDLARIRTASSERLPGCMSCDGPSPPSPTGSIIHYSAWESLFPSPPPREKDVAEVKLKSPKAVARETSISTPPLAKLSPPRHSLGPMNDPLHTYSTHPSAAIVVPRRRAAPRTRPFSYLERGSAMLQPHIEGPPSKSQYSTSSLTPLIYPVRSDSLRIASTRTSMETTEEDLTAIPQGAQVVGDEPFDLFAPPEHERVRRAAECKLLDANGHELKFGDLLPPEYWVRRTTRASPPPRTLVIFLRHFFCGMCQDYVTALEKRIDVEALKAANVRLVFISHGSSRAMKGYKKTFSMTFPIFTDPTPSRELYQMLGMTLIAKFGQPGFARPDYNATGPKLQMVRGVVKGMVNYPAVGPGAMNWKQHGGEFLFGHGHHCEFAHRMVHMGDHWEPDFILRAAGVPYPPPLPSKWDANGPIRSMEEQVREAKYEAYRMFHQYYKSDLLDKNGNPLRTSFARLKIDPFNRRAPLTPSTSTPPSIIESRSPAKSAKEGLRLVSDNSRGLGIGYRVVK